MLATRWLAALVLTGCGFEITTSNPDAVDMAIPPDEPPPVGRVRSGLIGFWTFDDPAGSLFLADTSGVSSTVPMQVYAQGGIPAPMITNGNLFADNPVRLYTAEGSHLAPDCIASGAVSLEAWVSPRANFQGQPGEPAFLVGLATNVVSRDIALLQDGDKWVGLVRTTAAADGSPRLTSTTTATTAGMTHLVLVASATQRILYVNGAAQAVGTPGPLTGWDPTYPLALMDEYQHARQWIGTVALVALYNRALSQAEVTNNFDLGANAP